MRTAVAVLAACSLLAMTGTGVMAQPDAASEAPSASRPAAAAAEKPRDQPMHVKWLLAAMALQDIDRFFERLSPPAGRDYFRDMWDGIGLKLPPAARVPSDGVAVEARTLGGKLRAILLTPPTPAGRNEAYYLLAVKDADGTGRLFALERSLSPFDGSAGTMLVGWLPQGRANYGPGPQPSTEAFVAAVEEILSGARKPMTLMPLPPR